MPRKRTFDAPPPRPQTEVKPPPRTLLMSEEEKRQVIEAHAARRVPMNRSQMASLWAGVMICVVAIGAGWVYAMRQSIANAIQPPAEITNQLKDLPGQVKQTFEDKKNEDGLMQNIQQAQTQLRQLQDAQGANVNFQQVLTQAVKAAASGTRAQAETADATAKPALPAGVTEDLK